MKTSVPILFIGGTGRSGTSIAKEILAQHPQVAALPFEYRFLTDPDGIIDFYASYTAVWSPYLADKRLKRLEAFLSTLSIQSQPSRWLGNILRRFDPQRKQLTPRQYHGWQLDDIFPDFQTHCQQLINDLRDFSFPAYWVGSESYSHHPDLYHAPPRTKEELAHIFNQFIQHTVGGYLTKEKKQLFVEDNTWNILFARELLALVPQGKMLHMQRDPRDVVASFMQQRWSPNDATQAAIWYRDLMQHWFTVRAGLLPQSYLEINLSHLTDETEYTLHKICSFANLPYSSSLLKIDLSHARHGRWRQDLSSSQQQTIQDILSDTITQMGYACE